ncbi:MAG: ATP synthase F1 subunit epsilon [Candidatus Hydrogenedens sp.]|nr:ATP synthase F1 subunit epsilon [Candidatus Hydrogenedens sp.]
MRLPLLRRYRGSGGEGEEHGGEGLILATEGFIVRFLAPEREPLNFQAQEIMLPGSEGIFTVLQGHTPFLTMISPGMVQLVDLEGKEHFLAIRSGFCEVRNDAVIVLVEGFEAGKQIDLERAEAARDRALSRLEKPGSDIDISRAEAALARALARVDAHTRIEY